MQESALLGNDKKQVTAVVRGADLQAKMKFPH